jgi:hypothetical protein
MADLIGQISQQMREMENRLNAAVAENERLRNELVLKVSLFILLHELSK